MGLLKARLIAARHNAPPAVLRNDNGPEFVLKAILSSRRATPERGQGDVSLLLLDTGVADHPGPALRLFLLELRHVRRAAATGQKMQLPVSSLDLRLVERRVNGPVELGNDGSRCFRWRADVVRGTREEPREPRLDHGWNVGHAIVPTHDCD